jgi:hypothetical protein
MPLKLNLYEHLHDFIALAPSLINYHILIHSARELDRPRGRVLGVEHLAVRFSCVGLGGFTWQVLHHLKGTAVLKDYVLR